MWKNLPAKNIAFFILVKPKHATLCVKKGKVLPWQNVTEKKLHILRAEMEMGGLKMHVFFISTRTQTWVKEKGKIKFRTQRRNRSKRVRKRYNYSFAKVPVHYKQALTSTDTHFVKVNFHRSSLAPNKPTSTMRTKKSHRQSFRESAFSRNKLSEPAYLYDEDKVVANCNISRFHRKYIFTKQAFRTSLPLQWGQSSRRVSPSSWASPLGRWPVPRPSAEKSYICNSAKS